MNIYYKHRAKSLTVVLTSCYLDVKYIFWECCSFKTNGNHARGAQGMYMEGMFF